MCFCAGIVASVSALAVAARVAQERPFADYGRPPNCFSNNSLNGLTFGPTASSFTRPGCTEIARFVERAFDRSYRL
jgi:hypothetical protein